jgi:hypothetical protein
MRRFEASPRRAAPKGQPSSLVQHRIKNPYLHVGLLSAFVTHSVSIFWQRADSSDHAALPFPLRYASEYACTAPRKASVSDSALPATVGTGAGLAVSDAAVADGVDGPAVVDPVGVDDEHPAIPRTATATTAAVSFALTMSLGDVERNIVRLLNAAKRS